MGCFASWNGTLPVAKQDDLLAALRAEYEEEFPTLQDALDALADYEDTSILVEPPSEATQVPGVIHFQVSGYSSYHAAGEIDSLLDHMAPFIEDGATLECNHEETGDYRMVFRDGVRHELYPAYLDEALSPLIDTLETMRSQMVTYKEGTSLSPAYFQGSVDAYEVALGLLRKAAS